MDVQKYLFVTANLLNVVDWANKIFANSTNRLHIVKR